MDLCISYSTLSSSLLQTLPSPVRAFSPSLRLSFSFDLSASYSRRISFTGRPPTGFRRPLVVAAATNSSSSSQCGEFSGLNTPLEPRSAAGRLLSSVLLDDRNYFPHVAEKQLEQLAVDRDEAVARMNLSLRSNEACLHSMNNKHEPLLPVHPVDLEGKTGCFLFYRARTCREWHGRRRVSSASSSMLAAWPGEWSTCTVTRQHVAFVKNFYSPQGNAKTWSEHWYSSLSMDCWPYISKVICPRRIAKLKESECQTAVEDVMYLLICFKFYEIRVHLVPQLSKCIYNGRLEIWPSKDWELESIHCFEVMEMIREHLTACVGWRANSNVTDKWSKTQVSRLQFCRVYTASVLFGYFLKSACLRHRLDNSLSQITSDLGINVGSHLPVSQIWSSGSKDVAFGHVMSTRSTSVGQVSCTQGKKQEDLKCYLMGFDSKTLQMCAKPQSKEAVRLIERHSTALFGDEETGLLETNVEISTSFATLKRFVLEAIAFGSFLWEAEKYVNTVYQLEED